MTEGRRKKEGLAHLLTHSATECCVGSADGRRRSLRKRYNDVVGRQSPNTTDEQRNNAAKQRRSDAATHAANSELSPWPSNQPTATNQQR